MNKHLPINKVMNKDCLIGLKELPDNSINTIYLDPPFYTQKTHSLSDKEGNLYSFNDKWNSMEEYINFLRLRLLEMKRVLKEDGNLFFHCDKKANHYIRVLLDEIFGINNFSSEIIWHYRRWSNSKNSLLDSHQNIYHYTKNKDNKFNIIYTNYSPTTNIDQILQERERNKYGKSSYKKLNGKIVIGDIKKGVPLSDVWDIPFLNPKAKERIGYPTQKPLLLLDRIIKISSNKDDIILDPFCGSGTTLVSAKLLDRKYIGFDINKDAIDITNKRLNNPIKTISNLLEKGENEYSTKNEYEKSILSQFDCNIVQRNKGLDAILRKKVNGKNVGIKIQKENESITKSIELLKYAMNTKDFSYSILVKTKEDKSIINEDIDNIIIIPTYRLQFDLLFNIIESKIRG